MWGILAFTSNGESVAKIASDLTMISLMTSSVSLVKLPWLDVVYLLLIVPMSRNNLQGHQVNSSILVFLIARLFFTPSLEIYCFTAIHLIF